MDKKRKAQVGRRTYILVAALLLICGCISAQDNSRIILSTDNGIPVVWSRTLNLDYQLKNVGPSGVAAVEVWVTRNEGSTWRQLTLDKDKTSPVRFMVEEDGLWGFRTRAVNDVGNSEDAPRAGAPPSLSLIIDTIPPEVELLGSTVSNGKLRLVWSVKENNLPLNPVRIDYSLDGGHTWVISKDNIPQAGGYSIDLPHGVGDEFDVRVAVKDLAHLEGTVQTRIVLRTDNLPPVIKSVTTPSVIIRPFVEINYVVEDDSSKPIKSITVWFSSDDGETWGRVVDDTDVVSPVTVKATQPGKFGFYLVATDNAGNSSLEPISGSKPMCVCVYDTTLPTLKIISPKEGAVIRGGDALVIEYQAEDTNFGMNAIRSFYSANNGESWNMIAPDGPNLGTINWIAPNKTLNPCVIKLIARDNLGNEVETISSVVVDAETPMAVISNIQPESIPITPVSQNEITENSIAKMSSVVTAVDIKLHDEVIVSPKILTTPDISNNNNSDTSKIITEIDVALSARNFSKALSLVREALEKAPYSPDLHYTHGMVLMGIGNRPSAMIAFRSALKIDKTFERAYVGIGFLTFEEGTKAFNSGAERLAQKNWEIAVESYESACALGQHIFEEHYFAGIALFKLSSISNYLAKDEVLRRAKEHLALAVRLPSEKRKIGDAYWYLARVYEAANDRDNAVNAWERAADAYGDENFRAKSAMDRAKRLRRGAVLNGRK